LSSFRFKRTSGIIFNRLSSCFKTSIFSEIDECGNCGGVWLDAGELGDIRNLYTNEKEKHDAAESYFNEVFGEKLAQMKAESAENTAKTRKIANMFRWICPTYYIPGKQEWGAF